MTYFVLVVSPMDNGFIGPFDSEDVAETFIATQQHTGFVYWTMDEPAMRANIAEFGETSISAPEKSEYR
jgi:hypothetical protein